MRPLTVCAVALLAARCSGTTGSNGTNGASGTAGQNGSAGAPGPSGTAGGRGPTGPSGPKGDPGNAGSAGAPLATDGARIKTRTLTAADGYTYRGWGALHDSMRNEDCNFAWAADNTLRCLPTSTAAVVGFADSGCSQSAAWQNTSSCSTPPQYVVTYDFQTACGIPYRQHVFAIGASIGTGPAATVFFGTPGSCAGASGTTGYTYFHIGAEVPPSVFVGAILQ